MAKALSTLQTEVQDLVDDTSLSTSIITTFLNGALADLSPVLRIEKSSTLTIVQDDATYTAPTDMVEPLLIVLDPGATTEEVIWPIAVSDIISDGFQVWERVITLQPTPTGSGTGTLYYYGLAGALSGAADTLDDEGKVPLEAVPLAEEALKQYAAAYAKVRDEDDVFDTKFYAMYKLLRGQIDGITARRAIKTKSKSFGLVRRRA